MKSKTAFVTGASGFTGSHLCRELVRRGYTVRALVRSTSKLEALKGAGAQLVYGDLACEDLPAGLLKDVDYVYHVAAVYRKEGIPRQRFFDVNAGGTERLLKAALEEGVSRFVHCSTVGVLGDVKNGPASESAPYNPGDAYQASKAEGEGLALSYWKDYGLPVTVVRPGAIYGPGDLRFLKLFRSIERGLFWMIGQGENYYHLVYIDDLVEGMIMAGECRQAVGEVFILAGEGPVKVKDLVRMIADALGRPLPRRRVPVRPVMLAAVVLPKICAPLKVEPPLYPRRLDFFIKNRAFDTSKARRLLGFSPKVDLRAGLALTAEWYRRNNYL